MKNNLPMFVMLCGMPASGKSTFREFFDNDPNWVVLSTDDYIDNVASAKGVTYNDVFKSEFKNAEDWMYDRFEDAIKLEKHIVIDQTNLNKKSRSNKLKLVPNNYFKKAVWFDIPQSNEWEKRLNNRIGKHIPKNILISMQNRIEFPCYSEGFDHIVTMP